MFSLTTSCCIKAHGTSDGKAAGIDFIGFNRALSSCDAY